MMKNIEAAVRGDGTAEPSITLHGYNSVRGNGHRTRDTFLTIEEMLSGNWTGVYSKSLVNESPNYDSRSTWRHSFYYGHIFTGSIKLRRSFLPWVKSTQFNPTQSNRL